MLTRARCLVTAAILVLAACAGEAPVARPTPDLDPLRARLLGALPPDEAARGVYVVDLGEAGEELSPGSRLAPVVAPLLDDATLLVETNAPPITLLGGVAADVALPQLATRLDDVVVVARPEVRDAVADRLRQGAEPAGVLAELAVDTAPVAWAGPTPAPDASGSAVITLSGAAARFVVDHTVSSEAAQSHALRELEHGGPVGSPGKRWSSVLRDPHVRRDGDRLLVAAIPVDLPGLLLRVLIDQRQLSFLPP